jgi:hypothetical protein
MPRAPSMTTLTVVLTHLDASTVDEQAGLLKAVAPDVRVAVCHGGPRAVFDQVSHGEKAWVNDPTLRGAAQSFQSYHATFRTIWEEWVGDDPAVRAVYVIEYDHLPLRGDFVDALGAVAQSTGAGILGKDAFRRNGTNWPHYCRFRRDDTLLAQLRRHSLRDEPNTVYGILGNGMWLSRAALGDYVAIAGHPPCYGELYVPTLLHHLGHKVVDVDAHSDLYAHVRWDPPFTPAEVLALAAGGASCVHPVKDMDAWRAAADAAAARA